MHKLNLTTTSALLIATRDCDQVQKRLRTALAQLPLATEDLSQQNLSDLKHRLSLVTDDIEAVIHRTQAIKSRLQACLSDSEDPNQRPSQPHVVPTTTQNKPTSIEPPSLPANPITPPVSVSKPNTDIEAPTPTILAETQTPPSAGFEIFEGVEIKVGSNHPRAGYVHHRNRREVIAEALSIGVPAIVVHHKEMMADKIKPQALGYKRMEKLIVQVKNAQANNQSLEDLWANWLVDSKKIISTP